MIYEFIGKMTLYIICTLGGGFIWCGFIVRFFDYDPKDIKKNLLIMFIVAWFFGASAFGFLIAPQ